MIAEPSNLVSLVDDGKVGGKGILDIYNNYTRVSGLHINPAKTELLTVNTEQELTQEIQNRTGISTVGTLTLLGIKLTDTLQGSIAATYDHIDTKAITRQIRISTKKVHMLHRRLLIQASLAPMYTHAFMALGSTPEVNTTTMPSLVVPN